MYDLIILGGGPAGYNAAERAGHAGLKTLVIEERALGGVCLNEGCIPTKTLLYSAKIYDYAKHGKDYGVTFGSAEIDHAFVVERKNKVVKQLVSGVGGKLKKAGVEVINASGVIKERNAEGFVVVAADKEYVGKQLLIATGSAPALPPIDGLSDSLKTGYALTNREVLDLKAIPKTIVVVGGGVIGLEMASYFNSVGSKVYVVEMMDHIAGPVDREISTLLQKDYASRGEEPVAIRSCLPTYSLSAATTTNPSAFLSLITPLAFTTSTPAFLSFPPTPETSCLTTLFLRSTTKAWSISADPNVTP